MTKAAFATEALEVRRWQKESSHSDKKQVPPLGGTCFFLA